MLSTVPLTIFQACDIHRGSTCNMSAHVLLNLLNELGERDKMYFIFFRNEFDEFKKTRAHMIDSIYHMTLRLL